MKKSFLASLLAAALVIGLAFPLSTGLKAKAVTNDEAIAQIKAAFDEVYYTETVLTPFRQKISSAAATAIPEGETADKSYYVKTASGLPEVGGEASKLGDAWALFNQFGDGGEDSYNSLNRMLYQFESATGAYPAASASKMKDYELSLYVVSTPENKDITLRFNSVIKGSSANVSEVKNISSENIGKWITIKSSDFKTNNWQSVLKKFDFSDSINTFQLQVNVTDPVKENVDGPVIYSGSVLGHFGLEAPAAFSDDNATLSDIVCAAYSVIEENKGLSNIYNLDKLISAVDNVISNASDEQLKDFLVSAYNKIEVVDTLKTSSSKASVDAFEFVPSREKAVDVNYDAKSANKAVYFENNLANAANLPAGLDYAYLGDAYLNFTRSYDSNSTTGNDRLMFGDYDDFAAYGENTQTLSDVTNGYSDLKVALYIEDVKQSGKVQFQIVTSRSQTANLKYFDIDGNSKGKWYLLSLADIYDGDLSALNDMINGNLGFIQIVSKGAAYKGYVGSFVITKAVDQLNVSDYENLDLIDTIISFNALSNIKGGNKTAFSNILSTLNSKYSAEIARRQYIKPTTDEIKSAYSDIKTDLVTALFPNKAKIADGSAGFVDKSDYFVTNENSFIANSDLAVSEKLLGTNFAHFNLTTEYDNNDANSSDRVLYNQKDGNWANFDTTDYDGFYINIYINKVMHEGILTPLIIRNEKEDVSNSVLKRGKDFSVTGDMAGKWITLSDKDLFNEGLEGLFSSVNYYFSSLQINLCKKLGIDAYFGSIVFYKNAQTPDMSNMTSDEIYEKAKSDLDNFDKTGAYFISDSFRNSIMTLGNLLGKTSVKGCVSGHYASGVTVRDAVKLQRYLSDNSIYIDRYAADINDDGIINQEDLSALFDLILHSF